MEWRRRSGEFCPPTCAPGCAISRRLSAPLITAAAPYRRVWRIRENPGQQRPKRGPGREHRDEHRPCPDSTGMDPSCVLAGYHVGMGRTAAEIKVMAEVMMKSAQTLGRQETWAPTQCPRRGRRRGSPGNPPDQHPASARVRPCCDPGGIGAALRRPRLGPMLTNMQVAPEQPGPMLEVLQLGYLDRNKRQLHRRLGRGRDTVANERRFAHPAPACELTRDEDGPPRRITGPSRAPGHLRLVRVVPADSVESNRTSTVGGRQGCPDIVTPLVAGGTGSGQDLVDSTNGVVPSTLKAATAGAIRAITKANPAVAPRLPLPGTHTATAGDVVTVSGVVGMT